MLNVAPSTYFDSSPPPPPPPLSELSLPPHPARSEAVTQSPTAVTASFMKWFLFLDGSVTA
jgi:hypothetical protein